MSRPRAAPARGFRRRLSRQTAPPPHRRRCRGQCPWPKDRSKSRGGTCACAAAPRRGGGQTRHRLKVPAPPPAPRRSRRCGRRTSGRASGTAPLPRGRAGINNPWPCPARGGSRFSCAAPRSASPPARHPGAGRQRRRCPHPARRQTRRPKTAPDGLFLSL